MMRKMMVVLAGLYRRWRYVEEAAPTKGPGAESPTGESDRIRRAIEREERLLADYRRNGCAALARERESTLRSLRNRLAALSLHP